MGVPGGSNGLAIRSITAHQPRRGAIVLLDQHRQIDANEPALIDDPATMDESEVDRGRRA